MRYLSSLNRKKILSINVLGVVIAFFVLLSFYNLDTIKTGYLYQGRNDVADGTEYRYIYQNDVLDGGKVNEILDKYRNLSLPEDRVMAETTDLPALDMLIQVYGWDWSSMQDISEEQFYQDRMEVIRNAGGNTQSSLSASIQLGYAEGWKNVSMGMSQCVFLVLAIVSILLVPIFNEDESLGVDGLVKSTRLGKRKLNRVRIINVFQISFLLYAAAAIIYTAPIFFMYGFQGAELPIQSNPRYFLSVVEMNYFQQFLVNLAIGYIAVLLMTGIILLVSLFVDQVYTGYAVLIFIMAVSYAVRLTDGFSLKHYFGNFLPLQMTEFNSNYTGYETYFGVSKITAVPAISLVVLLIILLILTKWIDKRMRFENTIRNGDK